MRAHLLRAWSPFLAASSVAAALAVLHALRPTGPPDWPAAATVPDLAARLGERGMEVLPVYMVTGKAVDHGAAYIVSVADPAGGKGGQVYCEADGHAHEGKRQGAPVLRVGPFTFWGDAETAGRIQAALR